MKRIAKFPRQGAALLTLALTVGAAQAGPSAGFCDGVTPPAPDAFEPNNTFETAFPIAPYTLLPQVQNFSDDTDVDWFFFRAFDFLGSANIYPLRFRSPPFGAGISMTTSAPFEGAGLFIRIFQVDGSNLTEIVPPAGDPGTLELIDQGCIFEPFDIEFRFDTTSDYAISLSQCRNEGLDVNSNMIADNEEYCIPEDPSFGLHIFRPTGFEAGELTGTVTDAVTMQPVPLAAIIGNNVGLTAYSNPATGVYSGLAAEVTGGTASVVRQGYITRDVQFNLVQSETTPCDITLMPEGVSMDSDLTISSLNTSSNELFFGESFSVTTQISNSGAGASPATALRFYLSNDATIDTSDTEIGSSMIAGIMAGQTLPNTSSIQAPESDGSFFFGACVDTVDGESNSANNCSASVPLTINYRFRDGFETPPAQPAALPKGGPPACTLL
ncbi:MAG: CARDB domain-containing protein [Pseudomonadota bacterium]